MSDTTPCGIVVVSQKEYDDLLRTDRVNPNQRYYIQETRSFFLGRQPLTPILKTVDVLGDVARQSGYYFYEASTGAIIFCPNDKQKKDVYVFPVHHGLENVRKYLNTIMDQGTLLDLTYEYYPDRFWHTASLSAPVSLYVFRNWSGDEAELFWTDPVGHDESAWTRTIIVRTEKDIFPAGAFDVAGTIVYDSNAIQGHPFNPHPYNVQRDNPFIDRNLDSTKAYRYTWFVQDVRENWTADPNASRIIPVSNPEYQELLNSQPDGKNFLQHYYHKDTP